MVIEPRARAAVLVGAIALGVMVIAATGSVIAGLAIAGAIAWLIILVFDRR